MMWSGFLTSSKEKDRKTVSGKQIKNILADAGVKDMQRIPIQTPNDSGIIIGIIWFTVYSLRLKYFNLCG